MAVAMPLLPLPFAQVNYPMTSRVPLNSKTDGARVPRRPGGPDSCSVLGLSHLTGKPVIEVPSGSLARLILSECLPSKCSSSLTLSAFLG